MNCEHTSLTTIGDLVFCNQCEPKTYLDITDVAKILRVELKKAFPATKFSVTTSRYAGGCSVSVRYSDGPPSKAVQAIVDPFHGRTFDGMDDSNHYHDSIHDGKRVHFPNMRPHVTRDVTGFDSIMGRIKAALNSYFEPWNGDRYEWTVLASMDLRWETPERAVSRFIAGGCR